MTQTIPQPAVQPALYGHVLGVDEHGDLFHPDNCEECDALDAAARFGLGEDCPDECRTNGGRGWYVQAWSQPPSPRNDAAWASIELNDGHEPYCKWIASRAGLVIKGRR